MKKFLELLRNSFRKFRPYFAFCLVVLFLVHPFLPETGYTRLGVGITLGITLLLVIFDFSKDILDRLDSIDSKLTEQSPPTYRDFNMILPMVEDALTERMAQNREVKLYILSVSGQFTWKLLIEDTIPKLLNNESRKKKAKLNIEFVIVDPKLLGSWDQERLQISAKTTLNLLSDFKNKYRQEFADGILSLDIFEYDNIPHWHAIMINEEDLFFGKCSWENRGEASYLQVGQLEYHRYSNNDRFGGSAQIAWVKNWFDAYRKRAGKLKEERKNVQVNVG